MLDLPTLDAIAAVPASDLPALLLRVLTIQSAIVTRLLAANGRPAAAPVPDDVVGIKEAITLTGRSESWLRKSGHTLPGFQQPTGRGGRVTWQRRALLTWAGRAID
jgi:hypothetical protein